MKKDSITSCHPLFGKALQLCLELKWNSFIILGFSCHSLAAQHMHHRNGSYAVSCTQSHEDYQWTAISGGRRMTVLNPFQVFYADTNMMLNYLSVNRQNQRLLQIFCETANTHQSTHIFSIQSLKVHSYCIVWTSLFFRIQFEQIKSNNFYQGQINEKPRQHKLTINIKSTIRDFERALLFHHSYYVIWHSSSEWLKRNLGRWRSRRKSRVNHEG